MRDIIQENIENGIYKGKVEYVGFSRLRSETVIDENKSIKWNREEVERINTERLEAREAYRKSIQDGEEQFQKDVIKMLTEDYPITEKIAGKLFTKAYRDGHSEGLMRVLEEAEDIAEIFE